ncbi:hypothetical protein BN7_3587 [Wickerhamomyces ciferrii]|uniref:Glutathione S-transferase n=1 Tax=Wickerhamomyces ciferrii (strain ATCC 14091 / BCRC 22168 / CBS 111 / JCM 3599 / NBRC 0793 / NRRL Y-1031 F-60-10) TaxID=1206466 RepID=K0KFU2_WICCF|nr:uncharacterized protein BN7_3587 [Wickerhamomyces ciferrii]CCH44030.1 hypothetical protein BN7_3587 [Wickerhamomyces ciferrii]
MSSTNMDISGLSERFKKTLIDYNSRRPIISTPMEKFPTQFQYPSSFESSLSSDQKLNSNESAVTDEENNEVETNDNETDKDHSEIDFQEDSSLFGVFPLEIWFKILKLNQNMGVLMTLNMSFYRALAPEIYNNKFENLDLLLVIKNTKCMKSIDDTSITSNYEYIDVVPSEVENPNNIKLKNTKIKVITSHKKIITLFKYILTNEYESILKKSIKKISLDVSVLDSDYNGILNSKMICKTLNYLKNNCDRTEVYNIGLPKLEISDVIPTKLLRDLKSKEIVFLSNILEKFASNKEQFILQKNLDCSKNLSYMNNNLLIDMFTNYTEAQRFIACLQFIPRSFRKIKITNRKCESKSQVEYLISQIIMIMSSDRFTSSINTSLSLMGLQYIKTTMAVVNKPDLNDPNHPTNLTPPYLKLYSSKVPNGQKISIYLSLLKQDYIFSNVNIQNLEQKQDWYLKMDPNGKLPTFSDVDSQGKQTIIFESAAILLYLGEHYDLERKYYYDLKHELYWDQIKWLIFQVAGHGPYQGQSEIFKNVLKNKDEFATNRFINDTKRIYKVFEDRLNENNGWLVGNSLNITDIAAYPWLRRYGNIGINIDEFPNVKAWIEKIDKIPEVEKGMNAGP